MSEVEARDAAAASRRGSPPVAADVFVCTGCGARVAADRLADTAFACPHFGDGSDVDHVLEPPAREPADGRPGAGSANPFIRYREHLTAWRVALAHGLSDDWFVRHVEALDERIAGIDGRAFRSTPFVRAAKLSDALGFAGAGGLWVKDETNNVSGSHKGRHLMGVMLYLQVLESIGAGGGSRGELAIASCGNAALAAAVVARAGNRRLSVFVPPSANARVVERLEALDARVVACERRAGEAGDPCYLRFHEAVHEGATPFCCQGPDNALTIEGGETLVRELFDQVDDRPFDRVFVQVGGGALASACVRGLIQQSRARSWGPPRIHAVQTGGGFPLARAWARVASRALDTMLLGSVGFDANVPAEIATGAHRIHAALDALASARGDDEESLRRARAPHAWVLADVASALASDHARGAVAHVLSEAVRHRSSFMWPWETEPHSLAHGILDDETYDWRTVVTGMLQTGGWPVIAGEEHIARANSLATASTGISVDPTGSAGLAGLVALLDAGGDRMRAPLAPEERVAVIFSGVQR